MVEYSAKKGLFPMKKLSRIIPRHTYVPFGMIMLAIVTAFYVTRLFTANSYHYDVSIPLDDKIPLVPAFIVVYILAYAQWVLALILASREGLDFYYKGASAELLGKLMAIPFFLLLPTRMVRPVVEGDGIFQWLTKIIYALDSPDNLFPSLHCMDSWFCLRLVCKMKKVPGWFKWANGVFTFLVLASVVLVKQHLFLDIIGGVALAEIAFLVARLTRAERVLYRIVPQKWQS